MSESTQKKYAMVFPGQGSQSLGMMAALSQDCPLVLDTFAEASEVLGLDLWKLSQQGPVETLNTTEHTQPLLLTAGVAAWRIWSERMPCGPALMAGHSLGEYTALVCANAIEFTDAVCLVRDRGKYMQAAVPAGTGAMAAIIGLDVSAITEICERATEDGTVSTANINSPEQIVIAGDVAAVNRAMELAKSAGAKRAILLPVSVPSHCPLMQTAASALEARLADLALQDVAIPVIQNVDAGIHTLAFEVRTALVNQLSRPVQWMDSVNRIAAAGIPIIIESGPGKVLCGLIKRINKNLQTVSINDTESLQTALELLQYEN